MNTKQLQLFLTLAGAGLLLITITPFLLLSSYVQPQSDDFTIHAVMQNYGFFEAQVQWYLSWTGRYFAHFIASLIHPMSYGVFGGFKVISIAWILVFTFAAWYFVSAFTSKWFSLFPLALLLAVYFWQLPSPAEAFYWIPATMSYQLGLVLQMLFFGLFQRQPTSNIGKAILVFLALMIPGTSEINLIVFNGVLASILWFKFLNRDSIPKQLLLLFGLVIMMSLVSVLSPGNSARSATMGEINAQLPLHDLAFTFKGGLSQTKILLFNLFGRSPLLLFTFILILIRPSLNILQRTRITFFQICLFWAAALALLIMLYLPFIYQTGTIDMPGRVLNVISFYFITVWAIGILITSDYFLGKHLQSNPTLTSVAVGIIFIFCLLQMILIPNKIEHAWGDKLSGQAAAYQQEILARELFLDTSKGKDVVVKELQSKPSTIFLTDIEPDANNWKNQAYVRYYGLKSLVLGDSTGVLVP